MEYDNCREAHDPFYADRVRKQGPEYVSPIVEELKKYQFIAEVKKIEAHPQFENFIRAFWRRIEPYKNDHEKELPEKLPIEFKSSMETALLQLTR